MLSRAAKALVVVCIIIATAGCGADCSKITLDKTRSRDGDEVRLVQKNCGATTDYVYTIYLTKSGQTHDLIRFEDGDRPWQNNFRDIVDVSWSSNERLNIQFEVPVTIVSIREFSDVVFHFQPGTDRK